jgi:hypothetical protein
LAQIFISGLGVNGKELIHLHHDSNRCLIFGIEFDCIEKLSPGMRPARGVDDSGSADVIVGPGKFTSWRLRRGADSNGQGRALAVGLHLNRRLRCQGIHNLDAVIVALKSWTTALLSWTSFTLNFGSRNSYSQSSLPGLQRFLRMIVAEGELTSGRPERSTI